MNAKLTTFLLLAAMACSQAKKEVTHTFKVGKKLEIEDVQGPTRPVQVNDPTISRDETIDLIYKVDSMLSNNIDTVEVYNGRFWRENVSIFNDSIVRFDLVMSARTNWRKPNSKMKSFNYDLVALNDTIVRFDYRDGITIYRRILTEYCAGDECDTRKYDRAHQMIDQIINQ